MNRLGKSLSSVEKTSLCAWVWEWKGGPNVKRWIWVRTAAADPTLTGPPAPRARVSAGDVASAEASCVLGKPPLSRSSGPGPRPRADPRFPPPSPAIPRHACPRPLPRGGLSAAPAGSSGRLGRREVADLGPLTHGSPSLSRLYICPRR